MKDEKLKDFPTEEQIDFVIDLKRKITLEKGFCTDADVYLAGLKAGRPEWHDLRKDPQDLPKGHKVVLNQVGMATQYDPNRGFLGFGGAGIIAWCEIPTFDKE